MPGWSPLLRKNGLDVSMGRVFGKAKDEKISFAIEGK
jgi:hypothetical protein